MELSAVDMELSAALNTPEMKRPGTPGTLPSVSITNRGRIWSWRLTS